MSGQGKFAGYGWHIEFHTTSPKKRKAADCIYLTTDRICQNKKSVQYLEKCFMASYCPLRVREKDAQELSNKKVTPPAPPPAPTPEKELPIRKINCSLPKGCKVYSNAFGKGKVVDYNESSMIISVQFAEKVVRFQYPNAILDKHLILQKYDFQSVLYDLRHAERG